MISILGLHAIAVVMVLACVLLHGFGLLMHKKSLILGAAISAFGAAFVYGLLSVMEEGWRTPLFMGGWIIIGILGLNTYFSFWKPGTKIR